MIANQDKPLFGSCNSGIIYGTSEHNAERHAHGHNTHREFTPLRAVNRNGIRKFYISHILKAIFQRLSFTIEHDLDLHIPFTVRSD